MRLLLHDPTAKKGRPLYNFTAISRIEGLDGLRLLAVGLVLLGHFGLPIVPAGLGVTIFFFISGFLITVLLSQEMRKNGSVGIRNFYIRRFLRLGPELLGLIAGSTALGAIIGTGPKLIEIFAAIFYFTNYYIAWLYSHVGADTVPYWTHLWSLSVEEHYYLTYPAIFGFVFSNTRHRIVFFASILLGCLAWRSFLVAMDTFPLTWTNPYTYMASEARMDSIAYGALFAFIAQGKRRAGPVASGVCLTGGIALLALSLAVRNPAFRETLRYSIQGIGLFLVFAHLYLSQQRSPFMGLLDSKVSRVGGLLSYGAYLWHGEVLRVFEAIGLGTRGQSLTAKLLFMPLGIALTFLLAWVSYRLLAIPALNLRKRFGSHTV